MTEALEWMALALLAAPVAYIATLVRRQVHSIRMMQDIRARTTLQPGRMFTDAEIEAAVTAAIAKRMGNEPTAKQKLIIDAGPPRSAIERTPENP